MIDAMPVPYQDGAMSISPDAPRTPDGTKSGALPRAIADAHVDAVAELDPVFALALGLKPGDDRLPDFSPAGSDAMAELAGRTLAELDAAEAAGPGSPAVDDEAERRCARLLRERLTAELALHEAGEQLRRVSNLHSPVHAVRGAFTLMPTATDADWAAIAGRLRNVPAALAGYQESLTLGLERSLSAGPLQTRTVVGQLDEWVGDGGHQLVRAVRLRRPGGAPQGAGRRRPRWRPPRWPSCGTGCATCTPRPTADAPDAVGRERYARWVREWAGSDLDLDEAYAWGWEEFHRIDAEMRAEAEKVLPGATPQEAMAHLEESGPAVEGVETVRTWLQDLMDQAIASLNGTHFDLAEPVAGRRGDDRAGRQRGGSVLHRARAGLLPPRPDLAADAGPGALPALRPGHHLVPRGGARPPPPDRAVGPRRRGGCRATRRRWARSAPTSRAGRCTRSA